LCVHSVGNLPALFRPGPRRRGICLITDSEARNWLYFFASFLISFLFLFSFLRALG
jgi:hypothetical protein